jgi:ATP-dependent Clp protease protease subunit
MGSFILAGGDRGKRLALPHSRIMIHQPEGGSQGQASEVLAESEEVIRIRRQIGQIYSERTGQPLSKISRDLDRDQFLSAKQAKEYGLVDQVAVDTKWGS